MRRAPWGMLAAGVAAAMAVLALVAGAPGLQGGAERALPASSGPGGERTLDEPWVVRSDRAGRGERLGWPNGGFAGRTVRLPFSPNAAHVRGAAG